MEGGICARSRKVVGDEGESSRGWDLSSSIMTTRRIAVVCRHTSVSHMVKKLKESDFK